MTDPEIAAMSVIGDALEPLAEDSRDRVLSWATARFATAGYTAVTGQSGLGGTLDGENEPSGPQAPRTIHELFDSASASTDGDRALLAAYWFQVVEENADFSSQQLNTELKQMGVGSTNITRVLDRLIAKKPALAQQVAKTGSTKQARKRYRLTTAGVREVQAKLRGGMDH